MARLSLDEKLLVSYFILTMLMFFMWLDIKTDSLDICKKYGGIIETNEYWVYCADGKSYDRLLKEFR